MGRSMPRGFRGASSPGHCSHVCYWDSKVRRVERPCKACGQTMICTPSGAGRSYCSRTCASRSRRKPVEHLMDRQYQRERLAEEGALVHPRFPGCIERRRLRHRLREHNRRVQLRASCPTLTVTEWQSLVNEYDGRCAYCGKLPDLITLDHVIPVSRGGAHALVNVVPACLSCNARKSAKLGWIPMSVDEVTSMVAEALLCAG